MKTAFKSILVIGAGKMGGALVDGWLANGLPPETVTLVDPALSTGAEPWRAKGVHCAETIADLGKLEPDCILLAVKPQIMSDVLGGLTHLDREGLTVLSIAAGITIETLSKAFPQARCVRSIPSTPAAIGAGVTGVYGDQLPDSTKAGLTDLLEALGRTVWVDREQDIDAITAVSGSGPAYVFHMVEALEQAALNLGLPADVSAEIARQTVVGSGALLAASNEEAGQLRVNVTSPGGTTAAGLAVLQDTGRLQALMQETTKAAFDRSIELAASKPDPKP